MTATSLGLPSLLVVDDDPLVRAVVVRCSQGYCCPIEARPSAAEAMVLLAETRFDIVLTDLRMPGVNGLALIRWVRERAPDTALVVASGFAEAQEETEVRSLGAVLLFKPFGRLELKQALIEAALLRAQASRA